MKIKKLIKSAGKYFFILKQENERIISRSVLIVGNGYDDYGHLAFVVDRINNYFPRAEISVLSDQQSAVNLQKEFPGLKFAYPLTESEPNSLQVSLQMLKTRRGKFDLIILPNLNIMPLITALIILKGKVILCNRWKQWWSLRLRKAGEIFKNSYFKEKEKFYFEGALKNIGLFFVLLERKDEEALTPSILIIDNNYASFEQIGGVIRRIKDSLPYARISILAPEERKGLSENFPNLEIIRADRCIIHKYRIGRHMFKLRNKIYDYIILLSLDITPVVVSVFMSGKMLLYNQWHQWWVFKPRPIKVYLMTIPRFIYNIIIFILLLISVLCIFLIRTFNIFRFGFFKKKS